VASGGVQVARHGRGVDLNSFLLPERNERPCGLVIPRAVGDQRDCGGVAAQGVAAAALPEELRADCLQPLQLSQPLSDGPEPVLNRNKRGVSSRQTEDERVERERERPRRSLFALN
jgi:hypothetical protein